MKSSKALRRNKTQNVHIGVLPLRPERSMF